MPYIMVMGTVTTPGLVQDDGTTIYGLNNEERTLFIEDFTGTGLSLTTTPDKNIRIAGKGLSLIMVNRLHSLFGYNIVSHSMAMTSANRELLSFTLYKKNNSHSRGGHSTHKQRT